MTLEIKKTKNFLAPIVLLVFIVGSLEAVVKMFNISEKVLPAPSDIAIATVRYFGSDIWLHFLWTLSIILLGLLLAIPLGILLAAIFSQFKILISIFTPLTLILVVTPMITIVPIFMLWFGFNPGLRFIVVVMQAAPIVLLNTLSGFRNVPGKYIELARGYGASKLQNLIKIVFPNALPQVFMGIKLGCIFSTIATISVEFVGGKVGLGYRVVYFSSMLQTDLVYGCIICIGIIGFSLFALINAVEGRIIKWKN